MPPIKVHEKALGHLSRGIYRSPASAIRELVSNGWDANATIVRVDTNYPKFLLLRVQDNGDGFTREQFKTLMEGGIGNSDKRSKPRRMINGRRVIGRIGIGLLGVAQICGNFQISSKTREGKVFSARVHLYDLLKDKLDHNDKQVMVKELVEVGTYDFDDNIDPSTIEQGTALFTDDVHPTFASSFQESVQSEKFTPPAKDWGRAMRTVRGVSSLQQLGDYWRLLWELSAACPVPYLGPDALPHQLVAEDHKRLTAYGFMVIVDNIALSKPVRLKGNPNGYTTHKIERCERKIYGKKLTFHGYIAVQEGRQIQPDELRGIMIRIKNVAIGYYDPSMLDYRTNEGPRSRWVTGEINVDEGLEDALNIDRDSFNRFHPEFRAIQQHVHEVLKKVFSDVWRKIGVRSVKRQTKRDAKRNDTLARVISKATSTNVKVTEGVRERESGTLPSVQLTQTPSALNLVLPHKDSMQTKKANQHLGGAVLALYEIANGERTIDKKRERFTELLMNLLSRW